MENYFSKCVGILFVACTYNTWKLYLFLEHQYQPVPSFLQRYLNQFGITPTNVKFHLSDCFVTSLQHQREFV